MVMYVSLRRMLLVEIAMRSVTVGLGRMVVCMCVSSRQMLPATPILALRPMVSDMEMLVRMLERSMFMLLNLRSTLLQDREQG